MRVHSFLGAQGGKRTRRRLRCRHCCRRWGRQTAATGRLRGAALFTIHVHGCRCWLRFLLCRCVLVPNAL